MLLAGVKRREALAALDGLSRHFLALPSAGRNDFSLATGDAGIALAHAALGTLFPDRGHGSASDGALARAIESLEAGPAGPSLHHGMAGVGWVIQWLSRDARTKGADDPLAAVDEALEEWIARPLARWDDTYDLIGGLVGVGVYALERLPRPSAKRLVRQVVGHLVQMSRPRPPGITWRSDPQWIPEELRRPPHLHAYDLGVAHGVPGVIGFLGRVVAAALDAATKKRARRLLDGAVTWLLAQVLPPGSLGTFPAALGRGLPREPARLAWCYGDPGVAAALLVAARGAGDLRWEEAAMRIALTAANRPLETSRVVCSSLCHGTAGAAHVFHRLYLSTGDKRLGKAARSWFEQTLTLRRARGGFAGFICPDDARRPSHHDEPGLLLGGAGVTLALAAAVTDVDPSWDRAMLLS